MIPVSLLAHLITPGSFAFSSLTFNQVQHLLVAWGSMGLGAHDPSNQKQMLQPWALIHGVFDAAAQLLYDSDKDEDADMPASAVSVSHACHALSYIAADDAVGIGLLRLLARQAYAGISSSNSRDSAVYSSVMHRLWQACSWLQEAPGQANSKLPRSIERAWSELQRVRNAMIRRPPKIGLNQREVRDTLVEIQKVNSRIVEVSTCDLSPKKLPFSVDVLVRTKRYRVAVEFDGDGHFVGPYGSLDGATMWRNFMLKQHRYEVVSISEDEWAAAADKQQFLLAKLAPYL